MSAGWWSMHSYNAASGSRRLERAVLQQTASDDLCARHRGSAPMGDCSPAG